MNIKPVIKWTGSKRLQACEILKNIPDNYNRYYEPFIGGGSILYAISPQMAVCGDICKPLISLWNMIKFEPDKLAKAYRYRWLKLQKDGSQVYYDIREDFNRFQQPEDLLFLTRTCVNGLIRFNSNGEFNNSFHHTRKGINPDRLEKIIHDWSQHIKGTDFYAQDYRITTSSAKNGDFVYLDPPYFHTGGMYYGTSTICFEDFFNYLDSLNKQNVKYMLSFDGKRDNHDFTVQIPNDLYKRHIFLSSGNSPFKKVMNKENQQVYESLYMNY